MEDITITLNLAEADDIVLALLQEMERIRKVKAPANEVLKPRFERMVKIALALQNEVAAKTEV